jgi:hypothetical protein
MGESTPPRPLPASSLRRRTPARVAAVTVVLEFVLVPAGADADPSLRTTAERSAAYRDTR